MLVVDDGGNEGQVLAGRPNAGNADIFCRLVPDGILGLVGVQSPVVGGVAQFGLALVDVEVDRFAGGTLKDEQVVAGALHHGGKDATRV